jgi:hypothetical protein
MESRRLDILAVGGDKRNCAIDARLRLRQVDARDGHPRLHRRAGNQLAKKDQKRMCAAVAE